MSKKKTKSCSKCGIEQPVSNFYAGKNQCKDCKKEYYKERYQNNKEKIKEISKEYRENNKEKIKENKKEYREKNKDKIKEYLKQRLKTDVNFKLACSLRARLYNAIKNTYKSGSAVKDLGCSVDFLKSYLESKFKPGMTWDNWTTEGWHIDHIKPLAAFDLTDKEQFLQACHYTNLQPLWAEENFSKKDKWEGENE